MSFERILELLALRDSPGDSELTVEQHVELEKLLGQRLRDQVAAVPRPNCCDAIQKYPVLNFVVNRGGGEDTSTADGKWRIILGEDFWYKFYIGDLGDYIVGMPDPEYCPFCGANVPKMVRKNPPPTNICRITDGGYYCDNCKLRLNECICDPPGAAFETCIEPPLKTIPISKPPFESESNEP